ncbi:MAG: methionine gamma-lyase [Candidatus Methanofastidiosum methylothiophilum]|uniref:Methionine gamma-lyase n=1 Tax=Candidatus Methanofastidiosum methylothiophilum TaxID=1705564 RepID=A0A150J4F1_9EURY|nr:MAG: methionine gamma-lyase [Candidatus Methanofastidiosum methylthiophilus]
MEKETVVISKGYDPLKYNGAVKPPIFLTSTYKFKSAEEGESFIRVALGLDKGEEGYVYSRFSNPNFDIVEERLSLLEGAEAGAIFCSGMAAITSTLLAFVKNGDYIFYTNPVYGGTEFLFKEFFEKMGVSTLHINAGSDTPKLIDAKINSIKDKLKGKAVILYIETPANPNNVMVDISAIVKIKEKLVKEKIDAKVIVDNTFMGPVFQSPLEQKVDIVLYSATKFIGGHSDVIAGAVLGSKVDISKIKAIRGMIGTNGNPFDAWLMSRSLETIHLRMQRQMENAVEIAKFLSKHPKVEKVIYPELYNKKSEQYKIYKKQCKGPGSLISFYVKGGKKEAFKVLNNVKLCKLAVSLGGTESLIEHPKAMTHSEVDAETLKDAEITDNMIRLSVGIENSKDLINDLKAALDKI